jgi:hypothetical protein
MLSVSLDCPFLIAPSVFSNVYLVQVPYLLIIPLSKLLLYNKCYKNLNKTNISIKQTETNTEKHDQYSKNQLNTENKQRNTEFYYF